MIGKQLMNGNIMDKERLEQMYNTYRMWKNGFAYIPPQSIENYRKAYKDYTWLKYYTELHNNCKNCPNYHVQNHEKGKDPMKTTHRCKSLATDHKDEYSRGYYPILFLGQVCPLTNKPITSKTMGQVMKLANEW